MDKQLMFYFLNMLAAECVLDSPVVLTHCRQLLIPIICELYRGM